MTLRQDIIERAQFCADIVYGQTAQQNASDWGERDGKAYLATGHNTVDGQALMQRMKNGAYKNSFHSVMRKHGAGY